MDEITHEWNNLSLLEREGDDMQLKKKCPIEEFSLVARFLTSRALSIDAVARTFTSIWKTRNGFQIRNLGDHKLLFIFDNGSDAERVLQNEPWSFDKHLIVFQRYNKDTTLENYSLNEAALWVQVHNIPLGYMDKETAEEICSTVGLITSLVHLQSDDFLKLIKLDASFILELFFRFYEERWENDDPMVVEAWLLDVVRHELLLLENQLPFFVIEKLYHLTIPNDSNFPSLIQLAFYFFKSLNIHNKAPHVEIQHFTDLLRFFQLPPPNKLLPYRETKMVFPKYSATQLREVGVTFKVASSKCVLDLNFKKGVLEIPLLKFLDCTEALIRNIMAEQCDYRRDACITDFYLILDHLINTTKDVDLLMACLEV
ncbi:UPF0481 protein At3g47200-like [Quercus suber]|uniref:UPF0481 protein At3g47200-like n=1 Tax=Quercus suber TaxID=58331 RepID=UPI0032E0303E